MGEGEGPGRMIEPWQIEEHVGRALAGEGALTGKRVLVTAGPTREAVDPVRYLGNRSSGRMGFAIAQAAWRHGAAVTLVSGPTALEIPVGVDLIPVESALEMHDAVQGLVSSADVTVFAAAVADFRPLEARDQKVKRADTGGALNVPLVANPDVAADTMGLRKEGSLAVGFGLETDDLLANAQQEARGEGVRPLGGERRDGGRLGLRSSDESRHPPVPRWRSGRTSPHGQGSPCRGADRARVASPGRRSVTGRRPLRTEAARLLRQRAEIGAPDLFLDSLTRGEALRLARAAAFEEAPGGAPPSCRRPTRS